MSAGVFPPDVIAAACASGAKWDIPPSVCLAQWALESGWGRAMPAGSNNPFGIKAGPAEPHVVAMTWEVLHGEAVNLPQRFRRFADMAEAFDRHGELLATGAAFVGARAVRGDGRAFAKALQGHYATDPAYAAKLIALMDRHDLSRFDPPAAPMGRGSTAWVQMSLNRLGTHPALAVDGDPGPLTRDAIRAFQRGHGLFQNGTTDAATVTAIEAAHAA